MSTFSFPDLMKPETMFAAMPDMSEWMRTMPAMPVPPLMVHPVAASAAASAVGIGVAAQMLGALAGSLQGAIEISRKYGLPMAESIFDQPLSARDATRPAASDAAAPAVVKPSSRKNGKPNSTGRKLAAGSADAAVSDLKAAADAAAHAVTETRDAAPARKSEAKRELAPEDYKRPAELVKPEKPDDLKQISGIGPKLEEVLNGLGIWTFAQIAGWTDEEVAWLDDYLQFRGRIERDTWRGQAAEFAGTGK